MHSMENIIGAILTELRIYHFDELSNSFILEKTDDMYLHSIIFDDIKTISKILEKHKIEYMINNNNFSIKIKDS